MNRNQWAVLSMGLIFLSIFLFFMSPNCFYAIELGGEMLTACYIKRYAFGIPAIFSFILGLVFMVLGWLEKKH